MMEGEPIVQGEDVFKIRKKNYRKVRFVFWGSLILALLSITNNFPKGGFLAVAIAFVSAIISMFMPCPYCGKTIGFRRWGMIMAGNAFGGWCLHCGSKLFWKN